MHAKKFAKINGAKRRNAFQTGAKSSLSEKKYFGVWGTLSLDSSLVSKTLKVSKKNVFMMLSVT